SRGQQQRASHRNGTHGERGLRHRADRLHELSGHRRRRSEHVRRKHRRVRRAPQHGPDGAPPGHVSRRRKRRRSARPRDRVDDGRRLPERIHVVCRVSGHRRRRAGGPGRRAGRLRRTAVRGPELDADHDDYLLFDHDHPADDHDHFVFDHDDPANDHNDHHHLFDDHYSAGYHHHEHVPFDHDDSADDHHDQHDEPDADEHLVVDHDHPADDDHHEHDELHDDLPFDYHDDDDDPSQYVPCGSGLLEEPSFGVAGRDAHAGQSD